MNCIMQLTSTQPHFLVVDCVILHLLEGIKVSVLLLVFIHVSSI